jgi:hypothetical protein
MGLPLHLGTALTGESFTIPLAALKQHFLALGGTGSGKTVLCKAVIEECIRYNLPCIAIDLQGDLLSLAIQSNDCPKGAIPPSAITRSKYAERLDVKVWTPGSSLGIPLSMAPSMDVPDVGTMNDEQRTEIIDGVARGLATLLGANGSTRSDVIAGLHNMLDLANVHDYALSNFDDLFGFLSDPPQELAERINWALPESRRKSMLSKLKVATIGLNGQRYNLGQSIDVNQLFGLKVPGPAYEGRARLSIIYLAHLSQDHQQEFLAALFASMYQWMLTQGDDLSGLLYMDEIAPFCPPVAKPPAKAGLMLLLRQARKYGLCTVLATQSPGDLDYKALGQIGTVALGRMSQRQDVGKVDGFLRSMADIDAGAISEGLANHKQGEFIVINPNHLSGPQAIKARWLATEHRLVGRDSIGELVSLDDRERFG